MVRRWGNQGMGLSTGSVVYIPPMLKALSRLGTAPGDQGRCRTPREGHRGIPLCFRKCPSLEQ